MSLHVDIEMARADFKLSVRFEASAGVTALFGRSGAGKTSVVNAVAGLLRPDAGRITLNDRVLFDAARGINLAPQARKIGYVFQDGRLFPHMTVAQNLSYGGMHDRDHLIDILGLAHLLARRPAGLSGGEKQRVALGRALMSKPALLLMDEPLAALDSPRKAEILPYLERLRDEGRVPILYVSHAMSEIARLADTLVVLAHGAVRAAGPLNTVLADPALVGQIGVRDAGAVIAASVAGYDAADQLTTLAFDGGALVVPGQVGAPGQALRLRLPAQDIILARNRPDAISALNVLAVQVVAVTPGKGPGMAVRVMAGQTPLLARVTARSARLLALAPGDQIYAIVKAVSVAPEDVG